MLRCALVLLVCGCGRVGFDVAGDPGECLTGYTDLGTGCYRLVLDPELSWLEAEHACEADGAHLVVLDDAAEHQVIADMVPAGVDDLAMGASDRITEGEFVSVTRQPMFQPWAAGEPDGAEDCVKLTQGELKDSSCIDTEEYICEYDGLPADQSAF